jgi:hypothetical protein
MAAGLGLSAPSTDAQPTRTKTRQTANPPITIGGFDYKYYQNRRMHMNFCVKSSCLKGSKVSYIFFRPSPPPAFARFVQDRKKLAQVLKARLKKGYTMTFDVPRKDRNDLYTLYSQVRHETAPDGRKYHVLSNMIYTKNVTISLISSSLDSKIYKKNRDRFVAGLLLWIGTLK